MLRSMPPTTPSHARLGHGIGGLLIAVLVSGCSMVPNMDKGTSGCSNAVGIGPSSGDEPAVMAIGDAVLPELNGLSPAAAATAAAARGHTVVFNVQIHGFGECWCVPPPEGTVVASWWSSRGALFLQIDGVDEGHTADRQPDTGWGC